MLREDLWLSALFVDALLDLLAAGDPASSREALVLQWDLAAPLVEAFAENLDAEQARVNAALVLCAVTLPTASVEGALCSAFETERGRVFLHVHDADGTRWLNKERFEQLAWFLYERQLGMEAAASPETIRELLALADQEGYRVASLAEKMSQSRSPE